jgi:DNA-directed RNA polymerase specialized sigma subunit
MIEGERVAVNLYRMRKLINRLPMAEFRIEQLMSRATKMTATLSNEPRGTVQSDPVADGVVLLEAAKESYHKIETELNGMRKELRPAVDRLEDPLTRTCMKMRYFDGVSAREIAYRLNYSERRIFQILKEAEVKVNERN